jgi:hypothetical protein
MTTRSTNAIGAVIILLVSGWIGSRVATSSSARFIGRSASGHDQLTSGHELVMVYVGSATCAFSTAQEVVSYLTSIRAALSVRAREAGSVFVTVGVADDLSPELGLEHLKKVGPFDEMMAGRQGLNLGVLKYVHQGFTGIGGTPQLVILSRMATVGQRPSMSSERVLGRYLGVLEIRDWLEEGLPLPSLTSLRRDK